jgi:F0F1-type ATP synthase membrane subunit b/b'
VPLGSGVIVDRDHLLELLERLRDELPDEMRAARWMVREREAFMARTNERAREIIDKAKTESRRVVSESHIIAEAVEEANILVRRAEGDARRIRLEAEDDLERGLERVDMILGEVRERIASTRDEFHQARPKEPAPPF